MKYVVLVSHGEFAPGLHKAVNMLAGEEREDVLSTSLVNGMGADEFAENVKKVLSVVGEDDEIDPGERAFDRREELRLLGGRERRDPLAVHAQHVVALRDEPRLLDGRHV